MKKTNLEKLRMEVKKLERMKKEMLAKRSDKLSSSIEGSLGNREKRNTLTGDSLKGSKRKDLKTAKEPEKGDWQSSRLTYTLNASKKPCHARQTDKFKLNSKAVLCVKEDETESLPRIYNTGITSFQMTAEQILSERQSPVSRLINVMPAIAESNEDMSQGEESDSSGSESASQSDKTGTEASLNTSKREGEQFCIDRTDGQYLEDVMKITFVDEEEDNFICQDSQEKEEPRRHQGTDVFQCSTGWGGMGEEAIEEIFLTDVAEDKTSISTSDCTTQTLNYSEGKKEKLPLPDIVFHKDGMSYFEKLLLKKLKKQFGVMPVFMVDKT